MDAYAHKNIAIVQKALAAYARLPMTLSGTPAYSLDSSGKKSEPATRAGASHDAAAARRPPGGRGFAAHRSRS